MVCLVVIARRHPDGATRNLSSFGDCVSLQLKPQCQSKWVSYKVVRYLSKLGTLIR